MIATLLEVFGDPLFEGHTVGEREVRELVGGSPDAARAVVRLHHAYTSARNSTEALAEQALDRQDLEGVDRAGLASEQVSDLIQRHNNHFPELEDEASRVWTDGALERENLFGTLATYLEKRHGVNVRILEVGPMRGAVRRYDPERHDLMISEVLRRGSRNFQLAHLIGLLNASETLDRVATDPQPTSQESRALSRVALANYFASAVLMPYDEFFRAAEDERYDLELLGDRFRASFEQVCHRMTTLHRRGATGVPFDMVRVDIAGNISKKFSASGLHFPRFGGLCPLWSVHAAFLQPGMIRVQLSRLTDGTTLFSIAHRSQASRRIPFGRRSLLDRPLLRHRLARRLVYADGVDLEEPTRPCRSGMTCQLCERMDCRAAHFLRSSGRCRSTRTCAASRSIRRSTTSSRARRPGVSWVTRRPRIRARPRRRTSVGGGPRGVRQRDAEAAGDRLAIAVVRGEPRRPNRAAFAIDDEPSGHRVLPGVDRVDWIPITCRRIGQHRVVRPSFRAIDRAVFGRTSSTPTGRTPRSEQCVALGLQSLELRILRAKHEQHGALDGQIVQVLPIHPESDTRVRRRLADSDLRLRRSGGTQR
jgi:predicted transcriptional regulator